MDWVLETMKLPPHRVLLYGQSLGTAVASAVAEHFAIEHQIDFAGVVLVAPFIDLRTLLLKYCFKGIIPILSPLRMFPKILQYFQGHVLDTWQTSSRIANLVRHSRSLNLALIHARNDFEISYLNSERLFHTAANATSKSGMNTREINAAKTHLDLESAGWQNSWTTEGVGDGMKRIKEIIFPYGGMYLFKRLLRTDKYQVIIA